jgi:predicted 3-demethylubiquinone-9 3-methyltransferase (glyoxalase superfamily)
LTISGKTGGEEMQCGRVKDKFGVSWQIVPANLKKCCTAITSKIGKCDESADENRQVGYSKTAASLR